MTNNLDLYVFSFLLVILLLFLFGGLFVGWLEFLKIVRWEYSTTGCAKYTPELNRMRIFISW